MGVKSEIPTPGSDEALNQGCTCPVLDNGHGMGHMGEPGIFVPNEGCPLHNAYTGVGNAEGHRDETP